ncbi:MAG: tRNA uridine-5-carboxymethylaminomethyl(34) synthesis GTPase MnmE [Clostridia bacterium]|nr:tRNA uridine-5-carboxymethylaminomethyl(34) synthesis GTPase MnmE [Clostridia bacterium]
MNNFSDTIAAISTAPGSSGVGIIRISGEDAFTISDKLFCRNKEAFLHICDKYFSDGESGDFPSMNDVSSMNNHEIRHGYIYDFVKNTDEKGKVGVSVDFIDECLLSKMPAPYSYTGENVAEINCHGSFAVLSRVLSAVIKSGARPAEPGEFTKRAFLNGKLDLAKAEAVMDIINSKTEQSRRAAVSQLEGRLSKQIEGIRSSLIGCLSEIDVSIDYPEYEMDGITGDHSMQIMIDAEKSLKRLSETYYRGRLIKEGINLVLSGCPNAGKSSLMNVLSGYNRAIVTDIPGTTRDVIEEFIQIDGISVTVTDTAGLRDTDDIVEKIGVDKAIDRISDAELVIYIADADSLAEKSVLDEHISFLDSGRTIVIINKVDVASKENIDFLKEFFKDFCTVEMSMKTEKGVENLYQIIKDKFSLGEIYNNSENILTNERHKALVDSALNHLDKAKESYEKNMPLDCISYDIWLCAEKLGEITGKSVSEDVVNDIFSRFCVGK